jgi:hypothetical protein
MKTGKNKKRSIKNRNKRTKKMRGGSGIVPFNLQDTRYVIPFNSGTGIRGVDPIAPANVINARNFNLLGGSRRKKSKLSRRNKKRKQRGGGLSYTSLDSIPDFFLGPRQGMTPVTAFGSTAGGVGYTQRELTGVGNHDGPNLAPNLGPGTKGLV